MKQVRLQINSQCKVVVSVNELHAMASAPQTVPLILNSVCQLHAIHSFETGFIGDATVLYYY